MWQCYVSVQLKIYYHKSQFYAIKCPNNTYTNDYWMIYKLIGHSITDWHRWFFYNWFYNWLTKNLFLHNMNYEIDGLIIIFSINWLSKKVIMQ